MFIAPKSELLLSRYGGAHFIIPQNASIEYRYMMKFKMLDNGAYESKAIPFPDLLSLASKMNVHEIVIPDVMRDAKKTIENAMELTDDVPSRFRVAIVPQGKDIPEFFDCLKELIARVKFDTLCFPKWLGLRRPLVVNYLRKKGLLKGIDRIHLLGLDSVCELFGYHYDSISLIRSVDTSKPFTYAWHDKLLSVFGDQHYDRVPMDTPEFSSERKKLIIRNMRVILNVVKML